MTDIRLKDFVVKTTPVAADLLYGADSSDSFNEVRFTITQMINAFSPALVSIAGLTTDANQMIYTTAPDTYAVASLTPFARTILDDINGLGVRATIGVVIGTDVQAYSAALQSIATLTTAANKMIYTSAPDAYAVTDLTAFARTLLDDADAATMQATLLLVPGTNVQAYNAALQSIAGLTTSADKMIYTTASNVYATADLTSFARTLLDDVDATAMRATLGSVIGTNVQAYDAGLQSISNLTTAADKMIYTTASDTYATADLTSFARTLLDDVDAASMRATLGVSPSGAALLIANNLSDLANATTARGNLGVAIGTDVQAYDATLQSLSALGTAADKIAYTTGVDTWAETVITSLARSLLDDTTTAQAAATLSVLPLSGGTLTGDLYLANDPTVASGAATKAYVDAVTQNVGIACRLTTTADLGGFIYNNGASGVGATLTAPSVGVFTTDGVAPNLNDRILIKNQSAPAENGVYVLSTVGTVGVAAVLTRATDYDQPAEIGAGDQFSVVAGTTYAASQWMMSQTITPIVLGTTALTWQQMQGAGSLLKANNLSDLPSAATSRTNLGLAIGTDVQAYDATLQSLATLGTTANRIVYTTGVDTWAESAISAFGRTLINSADASAGRTNLGVVIGTDVQAYNANLAAAAVATASSTLVTNNAGVAAWSGAMTNGQVIIGSTGATPVKAALTAGTGITITNGAGTITITSTATGSTSMSDIMLMMGG